MAKDGFLSFSPQITHDPTVFLMLFCLIWLTSVMKLQYTIYGATMKKVQLSNRSLLELPHEVTENILCRLPIKTCLNCKLVCKDWYKIIIGPHFADLRCCCRRYVALMLLTRFSNGRYNFVLLELDKGSNSIDEMGNLRVGSDCMIQFKCKLGVPNGKFFMLNVCNGLVCLKPFNKWARLYFCNFLVSRFVTIEKSRPRAYGLFRYVLGSCLMQGNDAQYGSGLSRESRGPNVGGLIPASGMANFEGSGPLTLQYKVLRIVRSRTDKYGAEILTLGSDRWRPIDGAPKSRYNFQASLNGSVHWYDNWGDIWAFHFETEKFSSIPIPDEINVIDYADITVFDSCLCFCCVCEDSSECEVWLMTDYGVGHSWVRQFVIRGPSRCVYKPLGRMDNGQILLNRRDSSFSIYDPETSACKEVKINGAFDIEKLETFDADFSWTLDDVLEK